MSFLKLHEHAITFAFDHRRNIKQESSYSTCNCSCRGTCQGTVKWKGPGPNWRRSLFTLGSLKGGSMSQRRRQIEKLGREKRRHSLHNSNVQVKRTMRSVCFVLFCFFLRSSIHVPVMNIMSEWLIHFNSVHPSPFYSSRARRSWRETFLRSTFLILLLWFVWFSLVTPQSFTTSQASCVDACRSEKWNCSSIFFLHFYN